MCVTVAAPSWPCSVLGYRLSFARGSTLAVALAVAVAVVVASAVTYVLVRNELRGEVDEALRERVATRPDRGIVDATRSRRPRRPAARTRFGGAAGVDAGRRVGRRCDPPPDATVDAAGHERTLGRRAPARSGAVLRRRARRGRAPARLHRAGAIGGFALQVARSLDEVDEALARIRPLLLPRRARSASASRSRSAWPSRRRCSRRSAADRGTAEEVTRDPGPARAGSTSPARTSSRAWRRRSTRCSARSRTRARAQRQLVSDASHELRTPLTSLRTNIEVLAARPGAPARRTASSSCTTSPSS